DHDAAIVDVPDFLCAPSGESDCQPWIRSIGGSCRFGLVDSCPAPFRQLRMGHRSQRIPLRQAVVQNIANMDLSETTGPICDKDPGGGRLPEEIHPYVLV